MGVMESIRKGFGVAAKSMSLIAVLFIFNLAGNLATLPFTPVPGAAASPQTALPLLGISLVFIILSIFVQGGSLGLVRDIIKEGNMKLDVMAKYGAKYFVRLLVLGVIILLFVVILALVSGILIAITAPLNNSILTAIVVAAVIAIAVIAALYFFIPFILSPYAIVCDEVGAMDALKKAVALGRKPFVKVFTLLALVVLLVLLALGVGFLVGLVIGLISALLPAGAARILMLVVSSIVNSYLGIVATASFMVYYLAKKEAFAK